MKLDPGVPVISLEDIAKGTSGLQKLSAALMAYLVPRSLLLKLTAQERVHTLDDTATIIFSSGSTGEPKGAMLSHYNIVSIMMQLNQVYDFKRDDRFLGVLFGLIRGLIVLFVIFLLLPSGLKTTDLINNSKITPIIQKYAPEIEEYFRDLIDNRNVVEEALEIIEPLKQEVIPEAINENTKDGDS